MSQKEEESQKADVKLKVEEEEYAMYAFGTTTNEVLFSCKALFLFVSFIALIYMEHSLLSFIVENTFSVCIETELQALEQKFGKCIFKKDHNVEKLHKRFMEVYKQNIGDVEQVTHKLFDINNKTLFDNHVQEDMLLDKDKLLELKNDIKSLEDQFKTVSK